MADGQPPPAWKGRGRGRGRQPLQQDKIKRPGGGRGKSRMNWTGQRPVTGAVGSQGPLPAPTGSAASTCDYRAPNATPPTIESTKSTQELQYEDVAVFDPTFELTLCKTEQALLSGLSGSGPRGMLEEHFSTATNPIQSALKLATLNKDFRLGRLDKTVTGEVLAAFEDWSIKNDKLGQLSLQERDHVFFKFSATANLVMISTAFRIFKLDSGRYLGSIQTFCSSHEYRRAAQSAIALNLTNVFDIRLFCVPLLVQGNLAGLEEYLNRATNPPAKDKSSDNSEELANVASIFEPVCALSTKSSSENSARKLVSFLDSLIKHPGQLDKFSHVPKPRGLDKLSGKPLEKLIKKYNEKYGFEMIDTPNLYNKLTVQDLIYWTSEIRNTDSSKLFSWRELMEAKLEQNPNLQTLFLNKLIRWDQDETVFWSKKLDIRTPEIQFLFDNLNIRDDDEKQDEDEEDWDRENGVQNRHQTKVQGSLKKLNESQNDSFWDEQAESEYYQLPFETDNIAMVTTLAELNKCVEILSKERIIGADGEFTASPHVKKLSLLQLATATTAFLLDMTALSSTVTEVALWQPFIDLFTNKDILIVGFGIVEDLSLLSKTSPALEQIVSRSKNIVCLEKLRNRFPAILPAKQTQEKGLSGFCEIVLGKKLNKSDQKSNWDRRPLRESQKVYAALDAYVCVRLLLKLRENAENLDKAEIFEKALVDVTNPKSSKNDPSNAKKTSTSRKNVSVQPEPLHASPLSPADLRVICDTMLQGVCKKLRICGIDAVALENGQSYLECVQLSKSKSEELGGPVYILSRGASADKIAKRVPLGYCLNVRSDNLDQQVGEVLRYFNVVVKDEDLFSRCVVCNCNKYLNLHGNVLLQILDADTSSIVIGVPAGYELDEESSDDDLFCDSYDYDDDSHFVSRTSATVSEPNWLEVKGGKLDPATGRMQISGVKIAVQDVPRAVLLPDREFWVCTNCGKIYWQGSHWDKVQAIVKSSVAIEPVRIKK